MKKLALYIATLFILVIALVTTLSLFQGARTPVHAQSNDCPYTGSTICLAGWAWSSNTGWISFNSNDDAGTSAKYDVGISSDGSLSGYAWSSSVGWISFNPSDLAVEPSCSDITPAHIDMSSSTSGTSGEVVGWARVISEQGRVDSSGSASADGWDGCLELSGLGHLSPDASGEKGVTYVAGSDTNPSVIKGFGWGGNVVGWVEFLANCVGSGNGCVSIPTQGWSLELENSNGTWSSSNTAVTAVDGTATVNARWKATNVDTATVASGSDWGDGVNVGDDTVSGSPLNETTQGVTLTYTGITSQVTKTVGADYTYKDADGVSHTAGPITANVLITPYTELPHVCVAPNRSTLCAGSNTNGTSVTTWKNGTCPTTAPIAACQFECPANYLAHNGLCTKSTIIEI